jgi:histone acetyltransferase
VRLSLPTFTGAEIFFGLLTVLRADLRTMGEKLEADKYASLEEFADDAQLIFDNCRFYNVEDSLWCKHANRLEKAFKESLARLRDL